MAMRQIADIDLLIRPKDFLQIKTAVRDLGYMPHMPLFETEERAYLISGYECAFDCSAGRNLLELQSALQPPFYPFDTDLDALFRRAVPATVAGRTLMTLSPDRMPVAVPVHP